MKKIVLSLISILFTISVSAQREITLENSLTGMSSQTKNGKQLNVSFIGNNSFDFGKHISIDLGTNYQLGYSPNISQNELIQKVNLGYNKEHWDLFTTYQYNYSLIREIQADNWIGIGGGVKEKFKWGKASLSYAVIYQSTDFFYLNSKELLRHSLRAKVKVEKKLFSISSEYFYQPGINDIKDFIILGNTKVTILPNKPLSFVAQEVINYRSISDFKLIQNITFGISYKFTKKFEK